MRTPALVVALCSILWAASASAQSADLLMERGLAALNAGDSAQAIALFEGAVAIERTPQTLARLAMAEISESRWVVAERHTAAAIAMGGPWVDEHRAGLEGNLSSARAHLGALLISCDVDGAVVTIGSEQFTLPTPEPLYVQPGRVNFEVSATGHVTVSRTVTVVLGDTTTDAIRLRPVILDAPEEAEGNVPPPQEQAATRDSTPAATGPETDMAAGVVLVSTATPLAIAGAVMLGIGVSDMGAVHTPRELETMREALARSEQGTGLTIGGGVAVAVGLGLAAAGLAVLTSGGGSTPVRVTQSGFAVTF